MTRDKTGRKRPKIDVPDLMDGVEFNTYRGKSYDHRPGRWYGNVLLPLTMPNHFDTEEFHESFGRSLVDSGTNRPWYDPSAETEDELRTKVAEVMGFVYARQLRAYLAPRLEPEAECGLAAYAQHREGCPKSPCHCGLVAELGRATTKPIREGSL